MLARQLSHCPNVTVLCGNILDLRPDEILVPRLPDQPAAVDMAVAEVVRDLVSPEVYAALSVPWRAAVAVREELRRIGPTAESLARSLLELGWSDSVEELPEIAKETFAA